MGAISGLHLDLNAKKYETAADLVAMLNQYLEKWEAVYGDEKKDRSPEERFSYVIEQACLKTGKGVVVLVDEYDKPLLQALLDENLLDEYLSYPESLLRCTEKFRPLSSVYILDRSHKICPSKCVQ